jgi:hypothetical protein
MLPVIAGSGYEICDMLLLKNRFAAPSGRTGKLIFGVSNQGAPMNLIYNSEHYSVVEFGAEAGMETMRFGGYEILDKPARRETFIAGPLAEAFRQHVRELIASEPSIEEIDEFLGGYGSLMGQPVVLH